MLSYSDFSINSLSCLINYFLSFYNFDLNNKIYFGILLSLHRKKKKKKILINFVFNL